MKIIKRLSLFFLLLILISAGILYLYIQSLPTAPPDFVNHADLNNKPAKTFSCTNQAAFNYAYRVEVNIESILNDKTVYQSTLNFNTQLTQANDAIIKGIASDILINEGQGNIDIKNVYYLSRVESQPFAVFTAFNDLGLTEKHPMKILAQLLKALSIGNQGNKYHFAYDSLQRTYTYHHANNIVNRKASITTANINQLASSLHHSSNNYNGSNSWHVVLDNDCMPSSLYSKEYKGISAAGYRGSINFTITAEKIAPYVDLTHVDIHPFSNTHNTWNIKSVSSSAFEKVIKNEAELWSILADFSESKNSAKLIKAADYLIDHIDSNDLAEKILSDEIGDTSKRALAFSLSLSAHDNVEDYLIETLLNLSKSNHNDIDSDLQKVRLMVALSGNGKVSEQGFQMLANLAEDANESNNVRNNALINLGSTLQQLKNQGQDSARLQNQLVSSLSKAIAGDNASSAILAAGNAKLSDLNAQIAAKLSSSNNKERYAAASILARNPDYNDDLLLHLSNEPSDLVNYAILTNLDSSSLSNQQKDRLREVAHHSHADIAKVIHQLVK